MNRTITIRLTPKREEMLSKAKRRFKVRKNSEAIDLALRLSYGEEIEYKDRIEKVSGCIRLKGEDTSVKKIRSLRDGIC
ncbi:transposase [Candidatus Scalindua japonica]|uniref:Transposase n=1 Tax=Candidatus Scalindua japonica TaxID=1284222 RepID=A0A286TZ07_9BACT|nr:hypothetical protein [Candidatus Scalindua japonica]GAX61149.1 transposase [Candidatus Scalindua japonica]